jgi:glutathione S-transferase
MAATSESLKLSYFNARGVIEPTRIMLAIAKVPYEDFRFPVDFATFSKPEFDAAKASGAFAINMDRVPLLEINGVAISQSKSIDRYIARRYGFAGTTDLEAAQIDMWEGEGPD